jgi:DNA-binding transcriptional LysR family regulator
LSDGRESSLANRTYEELTAWQGGCRMDNRDWLILKILYEQKNITKTAKTLYISQPALTARLQNMEEEFGVKIVYRTTKGVHFTPQGELLAKTAAEFLALFRETKEKVINSGDQVAGVLRIGATSYFTKYTLPHLLRLFRQQYPEVQIEVITNWSKDVFNLTYNQDVHIGFISSDYGWEHEKLLLFEEPICIASLHPINQADLPKLPRINYKTDGLLKAVIDRWWKGNFSCPPYISMEVDKLDTCIEMVVNGLGYAIMPSMRLRCHDQLSTIILQDKEGHPIVRSAWVIYHKELLELKMVHAFIDFIDTYDFNAIK